MKLHPQSSEVFNIVCLGSWNPAIFSPEWTKENLATNKEQDVILAIPLQLSYAASRLTVDDINIYPSPQSLILDCVEFSTGSINSCVNKLHFITDLLPHTPVAAIGVNFRYICDATENDAITNLFLFSDAASINAGTYNLTGSIIKRTFLLNDGSNLNLSIESIANSLKFEFNFDAKVTKLAEIKMKITTEKVQELQQQAISFLSTVYKLELEA